MNKWIRTSLNGGVLERTQDFWATFTPGHDLLTTPSFNLVAGVTAHSISDHYGAITLCLSGGIDSEYVLRLFCRLGLPVSPVIVTSPLNYAESAYAFALCEELGILQPRVIQLSINEFLLQHLQKVKNYNLSVLLGTTPLVVYDTLGGSILTGYGDPTPDEGTGNTLYLPEWDFYTDLLGPDHPGPFFAYSPQIFFSYIRDLDRTLPIQEAKCKLYGLPYRKKIRYDETVYKVQRAMATFGNARRAIEINADGMLELLLAGKEFTL